jgi:hypothetical protein
VTLDRCLNFQYLGFLVCKIRFIVALTSNACCEGAVSHDVQICLEEGFICNKSGEILWLFLLEDNNEPYR